MVSEKGLPSGKPTVCYGKSPFLMGKSTINGHFNGYVNLPEGSNFTIFIQHFNSIFWVCPFWTKPFDVHLIPFPLIFMSRNLSTTPTSNCFFQFKGVILPQQSDFVTSCSHFWRTSFRQSSVSTCFDYPRDSPP